MIISKNSYIVSETKLAQEPGVRYAIEALERDLKKKISKTNDDSNESLCDAVIVLKEKELVEQTFEIKARGGDRLCIYASDELGFIYGIYHISRTFLNILPFWFWNDQDIRPVQFVQVSDDYNYTSKPFKVRYRGWFINDEVLLDHFPLGGDLNNTWKMVFEALMRLGGNMTIPGTDQNAAKFSEIALSMGLTITHHHAEPLGARMFKRAYPDEVASYDVNSSLYKKLWEEAIERQKDSKVIFNLGFRGQGDKPFWDDDPQYDTPGKRGELISRLIRLQYDMVRSKNPTAECCTNLYGESMELYKQGFLDLPDDVILIWADNGFGKMVSRRQNNHNPRVPSLPDKNGKRHGIYYHASFYDLQAAAYLTPLTNQPGMVKSELEKVLEHGANDFWLINCSNVKMHCFYLELIAGMWSEMNASMFNAYEADNTFEDAGNDVSSYIQKYTYDYYGKRFYKESARCVQGYFDAAVKYGEHEDDHAGEQFPNHVSRMLMTQFLKDRNDICSGLIWTGCTDSFKGQIEWFRDKCYEGIKSYTKLFENLTKTKRYIDSYSDADTYNIHNIQMIDDRIVMPCMLYLYSYKGAYHACRAMEYGLMGEWKEMFIESGDSAVSFDKAYKALRGSEHGIWKGFYANDSECDLPLSKSLSEGLMRYARIVGDGPSFYKWQRECTMEEGERDITLILVLEAAFDDYKLYSMLKKCRN